MEWFRFYSEVLNDPKVQDLPAPLFRIWVNVLCVANEMAPRGQLPTLHELAYRLRLSDKAATKAIGQLTARGLIDDTNVGIMPHNWPKRQPVSDDAAARMRHSRRTSSEGVPNNDRTSSCQTRLEKNREEHVQNRQEAAPPLPPQSDATVKEMAAAALLEGKEKPNAFTLYEQAIGPIPNQVTAQRLIDAELEYGGECLKHALVETALAKAKSWRYTEAILVRHKTEGCDTKGSPSCYERGKAEQGSAKIWASMREAGRIQT